MTDTAVKKDSIYRRVNKIRVFFSQVALKKQAENKFGNYKYFQLGDFLPDAILKFDEVGLFYSFNFPSEDYAILRIHDVDDDSKVIEQRMPISLDSIKGQHQIQVCGSVTTYGMRYLLMMLLGICEHDAIDASEPPSEDDLKPVARISKEEQARNRAKNDYLADKEMELVEICTMFNNSNEVRESEEGKEFFGNLIPHGRAKKVFLEKEEIRPFSIAVFKKIGWSLQKDEAGKEFWGKK